MFGKFFASSGGARSRAPWPATTRQGNSYGTFAMGGRYVHGWGPSTGFGYVRPTNGTPSGYGRRVC
jgi:hypothetical protein